MFQNKLLHNQRVQLDHGTPLHPLRVFPIHRRQSLLHLAAALPSLSTSREVAAKALVDG